MRRIIALGTLGVYWIVIFVGTHTPVDIGELTQFSDKFLHFCAYAGLAFLLAATLVTLRLPHGSLLLPLAVAAFYGCADELTQLAVPGRQAEVADWAADLLGAGVGVCAFGLISLVFARCFAGSPATAGETIGKTTA